MNVKIEDSWRQHIGDEFEKQYFVDLSNFVREEYLHTPCYPPGRLIFNAFNLCPFDDVKVVIIGQDPYHEPGQAMGLSFSVPEGVTFPPSLMNIFKEIQMDLGIPMPATGDLTRWAKQGVLLLNATLTVRAHQAASHQRKGWEQFTDAAIKALTRDKEHLVFILWGGYARSITCSLIEQLGRSLHMRRGKVAAELGEAGIQTLYRNADILHCEPIEKVADDVITEFSLQGGNFDNLAEARYTVPDVWTMGKVYARLIEDVSDEDNIVETILQVFTSWIDSLLSDYNAAFYYQPRDYIAECYRQKTVLDG